MQTKQANIEALVRDNLVCPRDHEGLTWVGDNELTCPKGHRYPVICGIPVMLLSEAGATQQQVVNDTFSAVDNFASGRINANGIVCDDKEIVDYYVRKVIGATCGVMYNSLVNKLKDYPIPGFPLGAVEKNNFMLDIGCNWGRWSVSASRQGYLPIGIDHNLEAVFAARRVARKLNVAAYYLVADARFLPFRDCFFDTVFSYSVLQHFSEADFMACLKDVSRVMKVGAQGLFQMPNKFGAHNLYRQIGTAFRKRREFDVVYRSPRQLNRIFNLCIGKPNLTVDGFLSLNPQPACKSILPFYYQWLIGLSEMLKYWSRKMRFLIYLADSLYVSVNKTK